MLKTTIYLEAELALSLRQLAGARGRSQAELIREALREFTHRAGRSRPAGIGRYRSGRPDVSESAEKLLRRAIKDRRWP